MELETENTGAFHNKFFFILNIIYFLQVKFWTCLQGKKLKVNIAEGGNWPGFNFKPSQFPNEMLVDYIRVYQP